MASNSPSSSQSEPSDRTERANRRQSPANTTQPTLGTPSMESLPPSQPTPAPSPMPPAASSLLSKKLLDQVFRYRVYGHKTFRVPACRLRPGKPGQRVRPVAGWKVNIAEEAVREQRPVDNDLHNPYGVVYGPEHHAELARDIYHTSEITSIEVCKQALDDSCLFKTEEELKEAIEDTAGYIAKYPGNFLDVSEADVKLRLKRSHRVWFIYLDSATHGWLAIEREMVKNQNAGFTDDQERWLPSTMVTIFVLYDPPEDIRVQYAQMLNLQHTHAAAFFISEWITVLRQKSLTVAATQPLPNTADEPLTTLDDNAWFLAMEDYMNTFAQPRVIWTSNKIFGELKKFSLYPETQDSLISTLLHSMVQKHIRGMEDDVCLLGGLIPLTGHTLLRWLLKLGWGNTKPYIHKLNRTLSLVKAGIDLEDVDAKAIKQANLAALQAAVVHPLRGRQATPGPASTTEPVSDVASDLEDAPATEREAGSPPPASARTKGSKRPRGNSAASRSKPRKSARKPEKATDKQSGNDLPVERPLRECLPLGAVSRSKKYVYTVRDERETVRGFYARLMLAELLPVTLRELVRRFLAGRSEFAELPRFDSNDDWAEAVKVLAGVPLLAKALLAVLEQETEELSEQVKDAEVAEVGSKWFLPDSESLQLLKDLPKVSKWHENPAGKIKYKLAFVSNGTKGGHERLMVAIDRHGPFPADTFAKYYAEYHTDGTPEEESDFETVPAPMQLLTEACFWAAWESCDQAISRIRNAVPKTEYLVNDATLKARVDQLDRNGPAVVWPFGNEPAFDGVHSRDLNDDDVEADSLREFMENVEDDVLELPEQDALVEPVAEPNGVGVPVVPTVPAEPAAATNVVALPTVPSVMITVNNETEREPSHPDVNEKDAKTESFEAIKLAVVNRQMVGSKLWGSQVHCGLRGSTNEPVLFFTVAKENITTRKADALVNYCLETREDAEFNKFIDSYYLGQVLTAQGNPGETTFTWDRDPAKPTSIPVYVHSPDTPFERFSCAVSISMSTFNTDKDRMSNSKSILGQLTWPRGMVYAAEVVDNLYSRFLSVQKLEPFKEYVPLSAKDAEAVKKVANRKSRKAERAAAKAAAKAVAPSAKAAAPSAKAAAPSAKLGRGQKRPQAPPASSTGTEVVQKKAKFNKGDRDPDKPKRSLSNYMLWLSDTREKIKVDHPGISVTDIAKKSGELWQQVADKDKKKYDDMAREAKKEYDREMKAYDAKIKQKDLDEDARKQAANSEPGPSKKPSPYDFNVEESSEEDTDDESSHEEESD